jgi:hypothetical protein
VLLPSLFCFIYLNTLWVLAFWRKKIIKQLSHSRFSFLKCYW